MLKKSVSIVRASLRGSTYEQRMPRRFACCSLAERAFLNILRDIRLLYEIIRQRLGSGIEMVFNILLNSAWSPAD